MLVAALRDRSTSRAADQRAGDQADGREHRVHHDGRDPIARRLELGAREEQAVGVTR